jgi:hypothetical protein
VRRHLIFDDDIEVVCQVRVQEIFSGSAISRTDLIAETQKCELLTKVI